ncbi:MAG: FMN-binding protein [Bacteroidaceae bacterium]|nr:FMN-binding protein [Bacteroidaceae bacterium]
MDTGSNVYTIVYASVMVIIVAFLLAFVSSVLKPAQEANVENDTKGQILTSLNIDIKADGFNVAKEFENVQDMLWNGTELVPYEGKFLSAYGSAIKAGELHVFVAEVGGETKYVLPVTGRGLWGGLWGYIALNADKKTVFGTYFYHTSETAGLGARIGERWFQEQFNGKPIFAGDDTQNIALSVVKAGASKAETEVDGVTGATLTSDGVSAMVKDGLTVYISFINN